MPADPVIGTGALATIAIGIELEGQDDEAYEEIQYRRLAELIRLLRDRFKCIGEDDIVGHCDVAPGRKTDPGTAFDWSRLRRLLA
jgi:AmpD protein